MTYFRRELLSQQARTFLHTVALVAAMAWLAALLGATVAGSAGAVYAVALGAFATFAASRMSPDFMLRRMGARPIPAWVAPGIHRMVDQLAHEAELPVRPSLYRIPSHVPNALALGSAQTPALGLTDALLQRLNTRELRGVIAHEIGHLKHGDVLLMAGTGALVRLASWMGPLGAVLATIGLFTLQPSMMWGGLLLTFSPGLATVMHRALSREREHAADRYAIELTGDPAGLASALRRLERTPWWQRWFGRRPAVQPTVPEALRTHPSTDVRIQRLAELEASIARDRTRQHWRMGS